MYAIDIEIRYSGRLMKRLELLTLILVAGRFSNKTLITRMVTIYKGYINFSGQNSFRDRSQK